MAEAALPLPAPVAPPLRPKWSLGAGPAGGLVSCADGRLAHLSGAFIVLRTLEDNVAPDLIPISGPPGASSSGGGGGASTALASCPSAPLLAVALSSEPNSSTSKPSTSIYDATTRLRHKILTLPPTLGSGSALSFQSLAFSSDGRTLAALTTGSTPHLIVWDVARGRTLGTAPAPPGATQCAFMPQETPAHHSIGDKEGHNCDEKEKNHHPCRPETISVVGVSGCHLFALEPAGPAWGLKGSPVPLGKLVECSEFTSHAWMDGSTAEERTVAVGAADGTLAFVRGGFVRSVLRLGSRVDAVVFVPQGVLAVAAGNRIHYITTSEASKDTFTAVKTVEISTRATGMAAVDDGVVFATANGISLLTAAGEVQSLVTYSTNPALKARFCVDRPVLTSLSGTALTITAIATGRSDTVPLPEPAVDMAVHPSGHLVALSVNNGVRLLRLLASGATQPLAFLPLPGCVACAFSSGGQHFAGVDSREIRVWETYSRAPVATLTLPFAALGADSELLSLQWGPQDRVLVLTTSSSIWVWYMPDGALVGQRQLRSGEGTAAGVTPAAAALGGGAVHVSEPDGHVSSYGIPPASAVSPTEMPLLGAATAELPVGAAVTAAAAAGDQVFLGLSSGAVLTISGSETVGKPLRCAAGAVSALAAHEASGDAVSLAVGGADGSMTLLSTEIECMRKEAEDVVAVLLPELTALQQQLRGVPAAIQAAVDSQTTEYAAKMASMAAKIADAQSSAAAAQAAAAAAAREHAAQKADLEASSASKIQAAEQEFERRLAIMDAELSKGLREAEAGRAAAEGRLLEEQAARALQAGTAAQDKLEAIAAAVAPLEARLNEEKAAREAAEAAFAALQAGLEAERQALEAEADAEVQAAKAETKAALDAESGVVQRLRGEAAVLRQRAEGAGQQAAAAAAAAATSAEDARRARLTLEGAQRDLLGVKGELAAREGALREKDIALREAQERERVLGARCSDLEAVRVTAEQKIEERVAAAAELARQVENLRAEMRKAAAAAEAAELASGSRKAREAAARKESEAYRVKAERLRRRLRQMERDIAAAAAAIQAPPAELKAAVVALYQAHATEQRVQDEEEDEEAGKSAEEVETLRAAVARAQVHLREQRDAAAAERRRAVAENSALLAEVRRLQEEAQGKGKAAVTLTARAGPPAAANQL